MITSRVSRKLMQRGKVCNGRWLGINAIALANVRNQLDIFRLAVMLWQEGRVVCIGKACRAMDLEGIEAVNISQLYWTNHSPKSASRCDAPIPSWVVSFASKYCSVGTWLGFLQAAFLNELLQVSAPCSSKRHKREYVKISLYSLERKSPAT